MRALGLVSLVTLVTLVNVIVVVSACAPDPAAPYDAYDAYDASVAPRTPNRGPLSVCTVNIPNDVTALFAFEDGIAFSHGALVHRLRGAGCALTLVGAAVSAEQLLDVDDHGALYVFPADAGGPRTISTMLDGEYPQSMVARVSFDNEVIKLLPAGRGIWAFGVSPAGDALWSDACGPTGIFDVTEQGVSASTAMNEPATLWGVLTDARTFWSVGPRTCDPTTQTADALTDQCRSALVRTTPDGDEEIGATVVDLGAGFEQAALQRCAGDVCGVFSSGVIVWDRAGAVVSTFTRDDIGAAVDEQIAAATANGHGVYVTLHGKRGSRRVVFVANESGA